MILGSLHQSTTIVHLYISPTSNNINKGISVKLCVTEQQTLTKHTFHLFHYCIISNKECFSTQIPWTYKPTPSTVSRICLKFHGKFVQTEPHFSICQLKQTYFQFLREFPAHALNGCWYLSREKKRSNQFFFFFFSKSICFFFSSFQFYGFLWRRTLPVML